MKALLQAILAHRREMSAVAECAGFPCPMGGVQEARERVINAALDLRNVAELLAWIEAVEATERAFAAASKVGHFDDAHRAMRAEEQREVALLAALRLAIAKAAP